MSDSPMAALIDVLGPIAKGAPAALSSLDAALALAGGLGGALAAALALGLAQRGLRADAAGFGPEPRAPARFALRDGRLAPIGRAARRLQRSVGIDRVADAAVRMRVLEGPKDLAAAVEWLEREGAGFRALAEDRQGRTWSLRGAPVAGEARIEVAPAAEVLRDAAQLRARIRELECERDAMRDALDQAPMLVWRRDGEGRLAWANALYRKVAPRDAEEGLAELQLEDDGRPGLDVVHAGRAAKAPAGAGRRAVFAAESGERRWFDLSEREAADGGALGFGLDAAAAVQAEGALRRFVETLTETFAHLRVGLAIFDRERRLGLFNPALSEMMRLGPAWLAARPGLSEVLERLREERMLPDPSDFLAWRERMLELFDAADGQREGMSEVWHLPGETQIRVVARPHPQGAVAFLFEDVSETARLERRWRTEVETRRATMDRLEEGVAVFGPDGRARFANPAFARLWGFIPGSDDGPEGISDVLARFQALAEPTRAWTRLARYFEDCGGRAPWSEVVALRQGRRLRGRAAALPDGSILVAFGDVAAGASTGESLLRGEMAERMARRMDAPLGAIADLARMLRDGSGTSGDVVLAEGVLEAAAEMQAEIDGLHEFAACDASASSSVSDVLRAALDLAAPAAARRGVGLALDPRSSAGEEGCGGARVGRIAFNLLSESVRRAPLGAELRIGARRTGDLLEIWSDEPAAPGAQTSDAMPGVELLRRLTALEGGDLRLESAAAGAGEDTANGASNAAASRALPFEAAGGDARRLRIVCALPAEPRRDDPPIA